MTFSSPTDILERFGLHSGQTVADLGAGSGFYTFAAAKLVGSGGKVYAVEIQHEVLARLANHARHEHLANISFLHVDAEQLAGTKIAAGTVDVVLVCNILFQVTEKSVFVTEAKRILKTGGRVLVVDWAGSFGGTGPQPEFVVNQAAGRQLFLDAGFIEVGSIPAGDHHWSLVFRK